MAKNTKKYIPTKTRGRPILLEEKRKTILITLRLTKEEKETYQAKAEKAGLSLSQWIRTVLQEELQ